MVTTPIRKKEDIEKMKNYFMEKGEYRNYTLFVMGINTALRISDILELKWGNVYDFKTNQFLLHIEVTEHKTQKHTSVIINENLNSALNILFKTSKPKSPQEYMFFSGKDRYSHLSRNRAYHIIKDAALYNNIEGNISCHSLRKTFGYHAWKCGTSPTLIMNIYNHSSIEITKRYLSIIQDDKDEVFMKVNL